MAEGWEGSGVRFVREGEVGWRVGRVWMGSIWLRRGKRGSRAHDMNWYDEGKRLGNGRFGSGSEGWVQPGKVKQD